jgi:hypothetical protein
MPKLSKAEAISRELYRLVASGQVKALTQGEKDLLLPQHLAALAGSGQMPLTQRDKNRLTPTHLVVLAASDLINLCEEDLARLSDAQLLALEASGKVVSSGKRKPVGPRAKVRHSNVIS